MPDEQNYLYEVKKSLITNTERKYLRAVKDALPDGYVVLPQVSLRSVLIRTDNAKFQNELFRIADGLICRVEDYHPVAVVEINDASHLQSDRRNRDTKVKNICEEAGLPIITLWTSYGINEEYIKQRVQNAIEESVNPHRVKHSVAEQDIGVSDGYGKHGVPYDVGESINWNRVERREREEDFPQQQVDFEEETTFYTIPQENTSNRYNDKQRNSNGYNKANTYRAYAIIALVIIGLIIFIIRSY